MTTDDGHIDLPRSNLSNGCSAEKVSDKQLIHDTIAIKLFHNIANSDIYMKLTDPWGNDGVGNECINNDDVDNEDVNNDVVDSDEVYNIDGLIRMILLMPMMLTMIMSKKKSLKMMMSAWTRVGADEPCYFRNLVTRNRPATQLN